MGKRREVRGKGFGYEDKLWGALAYLFTPLAPVILLLVLEKRDSPYVRRHAMQALAWGLMFYVAVGLTSTFIVGLCLWTLGMMPGLYWGYRAYQGKGIRIPLITDFIKRQGWA